MVFKRGAAIAASGALFFAVSAAIVTLVDAAVTGMLFGALNPSLPNAFFIITGACLFYVMLTGVSLAVFRRGEFEGFRARSINLSLLAGSLIAVGVILTVLAESGVALSLGGWSAGQTRYDVSPDGR